MNIQAGDLNRQADKPRYEPGAIKQNQRSTDGTTLPVEWRRVSQVAGDKTPEADPNQ